MEKKCTKCKNCKTFNDFHKDKRSKDGFRYWCKECDRDCHKQRPRKKTEFKCESCGESKLVDFYVNKRRKTNFCKKCTSKELFSGVSRPDMSKEKSARWKGGRYISSDGYQVEIVHGEYHPSGRQKYIKEHIRIMESHIGRKIETQRGNMGEQIHHIDGDKLNNAIENLLLCSDTRDHKLVDCQLHELAFCLVRMKVIKFDHSTRKYYIDIDRIKNESGID